MISSEQLISTDFWALSFKYSPEVVVRESPNSSLVLLYPKFPSFIRFQPKFYLISNVLASVLRGKRSSLRAWQNDDDITMTHEDEKIQLIRALHDEALCLLFRHVPTLYLSIVLERIFM